jgi:D-glycero-beta-D-manno-heptose-7-phosphate kinase
MSNDAVRILSAMVGAPALVVGDVMLDNYLRGNVERISPEAPVPIVRVTQRSERLGGAANVALNMLALGAKPHIVGVTGADEAALRTNGLLEKTGLPMSGLLRLEGRRTTVKTRVIAGHQHVVRVDEEQDDELNEADEIRFLEHLAAMIAQHVPRVIVLEDYNKGVLTAKVVRETLAIAREREIPVAVDPKSRNFFAYQGVDLFKPNLKELREGLRMDIPRGDLPALKVAVEKLEALLGNAATLVTLSEHGIYAHAQEAHIHLPAHAREIADVSGAGDTVIATAALCMAAGAELSTLAALSNLAGGLVCEHVGVVPIDKERLHHECAQWPWTPR